MRSQIFILVAALLLFNNFSLAQENELTGLTVCTCEYTAFSTTEEQKMGSPVRVKLHALISSSKTYDIPLLSVKILGQENILEQCQHIITNLLEEQQDDASDIESIFYFVGNCDTKFGYHSKL